MEFVNRYFKEIYLENIFIILKKGKKTIDSFKKKFIYF